MRIVRDLQSLNADDVRGIAASRSATVAIGEGEIAGYGAAALLLADYAVLERGSTLRLELSALQIAGVIWRLNGYKLFLTGRTTFTSDGALRLGLCDATEWSFDGRSALAFDSAAGLIARRGGDALERAEFARLFATGEPQEGLAAFLEKRQARFTAARE